MKDAGHGGGVVPGHGVPVTIAIGVGNGELVASVGWEGDGKATVETVGLGVAEPAGREGCAVRVLPGPVAPHAAMNAHDIRPETRTLQLLFTWCLWILALT